MGLGSHRCIELGDGLKRRMNNLVFFFSFLSFKILNTVGVQKNQTIKGLVNSHVQEK